MFSYGRDLARRATSSIALPPGMSPGAVIGKGGNNIKLLKSRSGAHLSVNSSTGRVEVSGSMSAVDEALRLLEQQFEAFTATGASAYAA
jgi:polyribonucleotide nucleotidyltransferase